MKSFFLSALLLFAATCSSHATVSLQFGVLGEGRATGFANSDSVATNGMRWGIVVSTGTSGYNAGAGFNAGTYDTFDINTSGFLSVGGVPTDDYYVAHPTSALTATSSATNGDPGGAGGILTINPVPFGGASSIAANNPFQIIWFEGAATAGAEYGMMGNSLFLIPGDTGVVSFASTVFGGSTADPIKPANLTFPGAGPVPEPSRMMLLGFGLAGLFFRRRR